MRCTVFDGGKNIIHLEEELKKRFAVIRRVGVVKKIQNLPELDQNRWEQLMQRILSKAREKGLDENFIKTYWNSIHDIAKAIEIGVKQSSKDTKTPDTLEQLRSEIDVIDEALLNVLNILATENKGQKFEIVATQTLERVKQTLGI